MKIEHLNVHTQWKQVKHRDIRDMTEQNILMKSQSGEEMGKERKKMILSFAQL